MNVDFRGQYTYLSLQGKNRFSKDEGPKVSHAPPWSNPRSIEHSEVKRLQQNLSDLKFGITALYASPELNVELLTPPKLTGGEGSDEPLRYLDT